MVKLNSKCEIIADIKKFRSICYNGEAFAASSDTSNALSELRAIFNAGINPDEKYALKAKLVKIKEEQMK